MKIDISKLKEGDTIALDHEYDPSELNLQVPDVNYLGLLKLTGSLERIKNSLFFRGFLSATLELVCFRCLKGLTLPVREVFDLFYPYTGNNFLDTTDDIREVMILSYPVKFLCQEGCEGFCSGCGVNLNEETCHCETKEKSSPLGELKDWFQKKQRED
jgi:uncharacterized protein